MWSYLSMIIFTEHSDLFLSTYHNVPEPSQTQTNTAGKLWHVNSMRPSDAMWWHRSRSTLVQVMACCLTAPSHYLNQCAHQSAHQRLLVVYTWGQFHRNTHEINLESSYLYNGNSSTRLERWHLCIGSAPDTPQCPWSVDCHGDGHFNDYDCSPAGKMLILTQIFLED